MHHFVTEMCIHVYMCVQCCIVGCETFWNLWNKWLEYIWNICTWFTFYYVLLWFGNWRLYPCPSDYFTATWHYDDVIMTMLASQITSLTFVYSIVHSGVDLRKHQSSASLAFVREIHRGPVNFPHKWPVTRKMFPFDDVIMGNLSIAPASLKRPWKLWVNGLNEVIGKPKYNHNKVQPILWDT